MANYCYPDHPEFENLGEVSFLGDNGTSNYQRVDWLMPKVSAVWGDGRTVILGSDGYMELRKDINAATERTGDHLFLVNGEGEEHCKLAGQVGFPFFGQLILDCLNRTENAMSQAHASKAGELALRAQATADAARSSLAQ